MEKNCFDFSNASWFSYSILKLLIFAFSPQESWVGQQNQICFGVCKIHGCYWSDRCRLAIKFKRSYYATLSSWAGKISLCAFVTHLGTGLTSSLCLGGHSTLELNWQADVFSTIIGFHWQLYRENISGRKNSHFHAFHLDAPRLCGLIERGLGK